MKKRILYIVVTIALLIISSCSTRGKENAEKLPGIDIPLNEMNSTTPSIGQPPQINIENLNPFLCSADDEQVMIISQVDANESFLFFQRSEKKLNLPENYQPLAWSPSGLRMLAVSKTKDNYGISDWDGENLNFLPKPESGHICNYAWLTEKELLVSVCTNERGPMYNDDKTYILNVETGQYQKIGPDTVRRIQAVSPDGNLWFEQGDKLYMVRRDGTEKNTDFLPISGDSILPLSQPALVFSPSGDTLYFFKAESKNGTMLYDLYSSPLTNQDLKQEELLYHGFEGNAYAMRVSPDGAYMAVIIDPKDLYIVNLQTSIVDYHWEWPEQNSWPPFIFWAPDSRSIGFSSGRDTDLLYEMDISTGDTKVLLKGQGLMKILDWKCFPKGEK